MPTNTTPRQQQLHLPPCQPQPPPPCQPPPCQSARAAEFETSNIATVTISTRAASGSEHGPKELNSGELQVSLNVSLLIAAKV